MNGKVEGMGHSSGHEFSGLAYFVNGVNDSGGILPLEIQNDCSIPLIINNRCQLLLIDGSGVLRRKLPPLLEEVLF